MKTINMNKLLILSGVIVSLLGAPLASLHAFASLGTITITDIKCRIFTPNGDGYNDKFRIELDNPEQLPVAGAIFDVTGARVADIQQGTTPDVLLWDGKDEDGQTVAGGIYIYQLEFQGKHASGTLSVAR